MTNALQVFDFNEKTVRVIMQDGEPWWVAKDVCNILGLSNARDAISVLDDDEKRVSEIPTPSNGGYSKLNIVSESGLYTLIIRSNKPEAKQFKRWITHEVIPSIRKTGSYVMPSKVQRFDAKTTSLNSLLLKIGWKELTWEE